MPLQVEKPKPHTAWAHAHLPCFASANCGDTNQTHRTRNPGTRLIRPLDFEVDVPVPGTTTHGVPLAHRPEPDEQGPRPFILARGPLGHTANHLRAETSRSGAQECDLKVVTIDAAGQEPRRSLRSHNVCKRSLPRASLHASPPAVDTHATGWNQRSNRNNHRHTRAGTARLRETT